MKASIILALSLLLCVGALIACGPSDQDLDATATAEMITLFDTETAIAPSPTAVPTETPAPTFTPTPEPTPTSTPNPEPPSPDKLLEIALDALETAESYRLVTDVVMTLDLMGSSVEMNIVSDLVNQLPDRAQGVITTEALGETTVQEMILIGEKMYMRDPATDEWLSDMNPLGNMGVDSVANYGNDVQELILVGEETINGVPVYHLQAVKRNLDEMMGSLLPSEIMTELGDAGLSIDVEGELQIEYWITIEDGRFVKNTVVGELVMAMTDPTSGEEPVEMLLDSDSTTLYSEYDEPINILAPHIEVVDAPHNTSFGKMAIYESPEFPFMLQYPATWQKKPTAEGVTALFMGDHDEGLVISEEELAGITDNEMKLEEYTDLILSNLQESMPDFQLLSREQLLTNNGYPIEVLTFINEDGQIKASRLIYVHNGNSAFNATYIAPYERFNLLASMIDYSYDSLSLTEKYGVASNGSGASDDTSSAETKQEWLKSDWITYPAGFGPPDSAVRDLIVAPDGSLWVATGGVVTKEGEQKGGVAHFKDGLWSFYDTEDGLVGINVWAVDITPDDKIWFGTDKGISRFDGENWQNYLQDDGLAGMSVRSFAVEPSGIVWAGGMGGVSRFDGTEWTAYTTEDGLADEYVMDIAIAPNGTLWFGTNNGVSRFDGQTWETYRTEDGLVDNHICAVAVETDDVTWFGGCGFGGGGGISRFDGEKWTTFTTNDGLVDNAVNEIAIAEDGVIWIGTANYSEQKGGVSRFDGQSWINFTPADGLADKVVSAIAFGNNAAVWIGTSAGVSRYLPSD